MTRSATQKLQRFPLGGIQEMPSWLIFAFFLLLNLALKLPYLGAQPIALDEPFSIFHAQQSLSDLSGLFAHDNTPPLHYLVLHFAARWFGIGAWGMRLPALVFSCLAAALLFRSGERHFGRFAGIASATIFSLCNFHIYHAHEARTYALFTLLTLLALDRFLRLIDEPGKTWNYIWLAVWNALLIYTHFMGFWLILAQGLGFFLFPQKAKVWWRLGLSWALTGILYLPFIYVMLMRVKDVSTVGTWVWEPHWTELYGNIVRFLNGKIGALAMVGVLVAGSGLWWSNRKQNPGWPEWLKERKFLVLGLSFCLIYFGMFGMSFVLTPVFLDRYLLFTTVPLFLLLGRLVDGLFARRALKWAALGIVALGMGMQLNVNPSNDRPIPELMARIKAEKQADTPLFLCPPFREFLILYHLDREAFQDYRHQKERMNALRFFPVNHFSDIPDRLTQGPKLLYLDADSQFTHPENGILEMLRLKYAGEEVFEFGEVFRLYVFRK